MRQDLNRLILTLYILLLYTSFNFPLFFVLSNKNAITISEQTQFYLKNSNGYNDFTFKVGTMTYPETIELVDTWDSGSNTVLGQVVETLFLYNFSNIDLPRINILAQSYWLQNLTTLQVQLRERILFHDGMPFNALARMGSRLS